MKFAFFSLLVYQGLRIVVYIYSFSNRLALQLRKKSQEKKVVNKKKKVVSVQEKKN